MATGKFPFRVTVPISQDMDEYINQMVSNSDYLTRPDAIRILINRGINSRREES